MVTKHMCVCVCELFYLIQLVESGMVGYHGMVCVH